MAEPSGETPTPKPRRRRRWVRIVLLLLLIPVLALGVAIYLLRSEPEHWRRREAFRESTTPAEREAIVQDVRLRLDDLSSIGIEDGRDPSEVRIDKVVQVVVSEPEINALIESQLQAWMDDRGYVMPNEVRDPMVAIEQPQLVMAFEVAVSGYSQILSAYFDVEMLDDGQAEMKLDAFEAGQLPVPSQQLGKWLRRQSGSESLAQAGEWLSKLDSLQFKPVIELEHRRRARIEAFDVLSDGVELTVRVQDHRTYKDQNAAMAAVE